MKKWYAVFVAALALLVVPASDLHAQVAIGPQAVLFDFEDIAVGARVDFGLGEAFGIEDGFFQGLFGSVNGNYVFVDGDVTSLLFNANLAVPLVTESAAVSPYIGAGLDLYRWSASAGGVTVSDNATGLNVLGGLFFDLGALPAFVEAQYSTTASGFLSISAGVLFGR